MDKQNLMPQAAQPVNRITTGQLPAELAELSEEALQLHEARSASVAPSLICLPFGGKVIEGLCSYDGDDA
jgi:bacteriocin leader peptide (microcyclamide/patellamide family)